MLSPLKTNDLFFTFSPITVLSLAPSISRSGFRAHASMTCVYFGLFIVFPNKMLFLREAFWIQACCGTYAESPYNKKTDAYSKA